MAKKNNSTSPSIPPLAVILAWLIPGAGHIYLGRRVRGIVVMATIAVTFWSGVAMGGVMTVDSRYERWWFLGQMCTGIHGVVGWYRQHLVYRDVERLIGSVEAPRPYTVGPRQMQVDALLAEHRARDYRDAPKHLQGLALVAPVETPARAYAGVAGLLNIMCIFDALMLSLMGIRGEQPRPRSGGSNGQDEPVRPEDA